MIWLSFQNLLEYRVNLMWNLFSNFVSFSILFLLWSTILNSGFGKGDYTQNSLAIYYISISLVTLVSDYNYHLIADDIRLGILSTDLVRPYSYYLKVFVQAIPNKIIPILIFLVVSSILVSLNLFNPSFFGVAEAIVAIVLATILRFFIVLMIGGMAFWFNRVHGFYSLFFSLGGIFSGELIPSNLLPTGLAKIGNYLPFKYIAYVPAHYFVNEATLTVFIKNILAQLFWILLLYLATRYVWKKGLLRYESAGR